MYGVEQSLLILACPYTSQFVSAHCTSHLPIKYDHYVRYVRSIIACDSSMAIEWTVNVF